MAFRLTGNISLRKIRKFSAATFLMASLGVGFISCGSSDDPFSSGVAFVDVRTTPNSIDAGDATFVVIDVDDIDDENFFLKVRFPLGLEYIAGTSFVEVDGEDLFREPDLVFTSQTERRNFMIYFLSKSELDDEADTRVSFDLAGVSRVTDGRIEVDPDFDNPNVRNSEEFDPEEPQFSAESDTFIEVS